MKKLMIIVFPLFLCLLPPSAAGEMVTVTFDTNIFDVLFENDQYQVSGKKVNLPAGDEVQFTMGGKPCIVYHLTGYSSGQASLSGRTLSITAASGMGVQMEMEISACIPPSSSNCTEVQKLMGTCVETNSMSPIVECKYLFRCDIVDCEQICNNINASP